MSTRGLIPLLAAVLAVGAAATTVGVFARPERPQQQSAVADFTEAQNAANCCSQDGCVTSANPAKTGSCCNVASGAETCSECDGEQVQKIKLAQGPQFGRGAGQGFGRGRGPGAGRGFGQGRDEKFTEDHNVFFFLLEHRDAIRRTVKNLPNGIETVTESDDPEVVGKIQEHVAAMYERIENVKPIHMRDPLFRELFANTTKIEMKMDDTDHGIRVIETSTDSYVVKLLQEHARVVSLLIKNGHDELHRNHPLPSREPASRIIDGVEWKALPASATAPKDNPTTTAKVELGKKLFFDPRLSLTGTVSCNSCHNVMEGGDDGRPSSMGILGRVGPRNAPTVWNAAFQASQFWDGRSPSLEDQAKGPLLAPPEMGMPSHDFVVDRIRSVPGYVAEFAEVFSEENSLNIDNTAKAIAAFERTLITPNSPYDRFVAGDKAAFNDQQARGMKLFASIGCTECHSGPAFNGWTFGASPEFQEFPRYSQSELVEKFDLLNDKGRSVVSKEDSDLHHFKVPTLRNTSLTAPYFHNGAVDSLSEAVRVMAQIQLDTTLPDDKIAEITAFLTTLEGEFPPITLPRIPSRSGGTALKDQQPAQVGH